MRSRTSKGSEGSGSSLRPAPQWPHGSTSVPRGSPTAGGRPGAPPSKTPPRTPRPRGAPTTPPRTADAQTVFLVLLAIARDAASAVRRPDAVRAAMIGVDEDVAAILEGLATQIQQGGVAPAIDVTGSLAAFERSITTQVDATGEEGTDAGALGLDRGLAVAVNRVASSDRRSIRATAVSPVAH